MKVAAPRLSSVALPLCTPISMLARVVTVQVGRAWRRVDRKYFASPLTGPERNIERGGAGVGKLGLGCSERSCGFQSSCIVRRVSGRLRNIFRQQSGFATPAWFPAGYMCCCSIATPVRLRTHTCACVRVYVCVRARCACALSGGRGGIAGLAGRVGWSNWLVELVGRNGW